MDTIQSLVIVAQTAASSAATPKPPGGIGVADIIVLLGLGWGFFRGYRGGFTTEIWSILGTGMVVGAAFLGFGALSGVLQPMMGKSLTTQDVDWMSFLIISLVLMLLYQLVRQRFLTKVNIFLTSRIESWGGGIGGAFRMTLFMGWVIIAICLMPSWHLLHYYCVYDAQSGWWLAEKSPAVMQVVKPSYPIALQELKTIKEKLSPKEFNLDTETPKSAPRKK